MQWIELSIWCEANQAQGISAILAEFGHGGALTEEWLSATDSARSCTVKIYIPFSRTYSVLKVEIESHLSRAGYPHKLLEKMLQQDEWFKSLKNDFKVIEIGQRLVIKPTWIKEPKNYPGRIIIEVDPGAAFGTGLHPTTRLCLLNLEKYLKPGMTVFDLGTGTGILAIAAAKLGASNVIASDIDAVAVKTARSNAKVNLVSDKIQVKRGTLSPSVQTKYRTGFDIVMANITSRAISDLSPALMDVLKPGGLLIVSGIHPDGLDEVLIRLSLTKLSLVSDETDQDWHAVVARKEIDQNKNIQGARE